MEKKSRYNMSASHAFVNRVGMLYNLIPQRPYNEVIDSYIHQNAFQEARHHNNEEELRSALQTLCNLKDARDYRNNFDGGLDVPTYEEWRKAWDNAKELLR